MLKHWLLRHNNCKTIVLVATACITFSPELSAQQPVPPISARARMQMQAALAEKASWTATQQKIDSNLLLELALQRGGIAGTFPKLHSGIKLASDGTALVDIEATVNGQLETELIALGVVIVDAVPRFDAIRARVPLPQLESVAALPAVRLIRPAFAPAKRKINTSEGDIAHRADRVRTAFGIDGTGVKIGVISDSVDYLAFAEGSGDLPPGLVTSLPGQDGTDACLPNPSCSGEGTAMFEIIHDLAPGASLYFATGHSSPARMAANIIALRSVYGCDIIVDDIAYLDQPPLAPGIIEQTVDFVASQGVLYFSAAGNDRGASWEGDFVNSGQDIGNPDGAPDYAHDFNAGRIFNVIMDDSDDPIYLWWADPLNASANDYDLWLFEGDGDALGDLVARSINAQNGDDSPSELINSRDLDHTGHRLVVTKSVRPGRIPQDRYLWLSIFGNGTGKLEVSTTGAVYGHPAAQGAMAVGAVDVASAHSGPFSSSPDVSVARYSSNGPRRVFFNSEGTPFTPGVFSSAGGLVRLKPDLVGAAGVHTVTPGFTDFHGTSAAAPHCAAVAALVLQANPAFGSSDVRSVLSATALDIGEPGWDQDAGYGVCDAFRAVSRVVEGSCCLDVDAACTDGVAETCEGTGIFGQAEECDERTYPCPAAEPGPNAHLVICLDRSGSMLEALRGTDKTRCEDALNQAKADLTAFTQLKPDGTSGFPERRVAVVTFAGSVDGLERGFMSALAARLILDGLHPTGCAGTTALADAVCGAADLLSSIDGLAQHDRLIAIESDGKENQSRGECAGVDSEFGPPPAGNYDAGSWERRIWDKINEQSVVLARHWSDASTLAQSRSMVFDAELGALRRAEPSLQDFLRDLALTSGGNYSDIADDQCMTQFDADGSFYLDRADLKRFLACLGGPSVSPGPECACFMRPGRTTVSLQDFVAMQTDFGCKEGAFCDDGNRCTILDACSAGKCSGIAAPPCNDQNSCTDDSCDPDLGCVFSPNARNCDDGLYCNGADKCGNGACSVHAGNPCSGPDGDSDCSESCNEAADNCTANDPNQTTCNDGLYCNGADKCSNGACSVHAGNPCPGPDGDSDCSETCNEAVDTCTANDPNQSACDDGLYCNGADKCNNGLCSVHAGNPCPGADGDSDCTESCNEAANNCTAKDPNQSACDDGLYCNGADKCKNGLCSVHAGNPCPGADGDSDCSESCSEAANRCSANDPNGSACNDNQSCNGTDQCNDGQCAIHSACTSPCTGCPTVSITQPAQDILTADPNYAFDGYVDYGNSIRLWYTEVTLRAAATDTEDGALTGLQLRWTTNRGYLQPGLTDLLGRGNEIRVRLHSDINSLVHTITLRATDSDGNSVAVTRHILIWGLE